MQMVPSGTNMEDNLALSMPIVVKKKQKIKTQKTRIFASTLPRHSPLTESLGSGACGL